MNIVACLEAVFRRIGGLTASLRREGGLACTMARKITCAFGFERVGKLTGTATRVSGMTCSFGLICTTSLGDEWPLWASDQMVLTIDGGKVYVTKETT